MDYNARYYSPVLGRFISADTIVPEPGNPQAFNRYSYVNNNPLNYVDPSGHCRHNEDGDYEYGTDCTADEFNELSWEERTQWIDDFSAESGVAWFENVKGIIEYFASDPVFQNSEWAKLSDAGVLQAIQDGWRLHNGQDAIGYGDTNAGGGWKDFFDAYSKDRGGATSFTKWGTAEQAGVDYGTAIASHLRNQAASREQVQIDTFTGWGNIYRGIVGGKFNIPDAIFSPVGTANNPFIENGALRLPYVTTPYNSQGFVNAFSHLIISPMAAGLHSGYVTGTNGSHGLLR